jgi:hypothetical protein
MPIDDLIVAATLADVDRGRAAAALARTLTELYGPCRCAIQPRTPKTVSPCERHAVDPGLFRRLVWAGLGA